MRCIAFNGFATTGHAVSAFLLSFRQSENKRRGFAFFCYNAFARGIVVALSGTGGEYASDSKTDPNGGSHCRHAVVQLGG
jgi:hypothetical protein